MILALWGKERDKGRLDDGGRRAEALAWQYLINSPGGSEMKSNEGKSGSYTRASHQR